MGLAGLAVVSQYGELLISAPMNKNDKQVQAGTGDFLNV